MVKSAPSITVALPGMDSCPSCGKTFWCSSKPWYVETSHLSWPSPSANRKSLSSSAHPKYAAPSASSDSPASPSSPILSPSSISDRPLSAYFQIAISSLPIPGENMCNLYFMHLAHDSPENTASAPLWGNGLWIYARVYLFSHISLDRRIYTGVIAEQRAFEYDQI